MHPLGSPLTLHLAAKTGGAPWFRAPNDGGQKRTAPPVRFLGPPIHSVPEHPQTGFRTFRRGV